MTDLEPRTTGVWLSCQHPKPDPKMRLFCFPFAGGGAWIFRDWSRALPAFVEVHAVQLPGRERRVREESCTHIEPLVSGMASAFEAFLHEPFAFFGHSMGAILAFEMARRLQVTHGVQPVHLIASGHRAPHLPDPMDPIHELPHEEFIEELRKLNGTPPEVFQSAELLDLVVPILRADFSVCETYAFRDALPLACPITVFGGLQDPEVDRPALDAWSQHTSGPCVVRMFPGDHFFIQTERPTVLNTLSAELDRLLAEVERP